jgi:Zn-dependent metalloprotease
MIRAYSFMVTLLFFCILLILAPFFTPVAQSQPEFKDPRLIAHPAELKVLDASRQSLLSEVKAKSLTPVTITIDEKTGAVLLLDFTIPTEAKTTEDRNRFAFEFIRSYQALIDPKINPEEYVISTALKDCDSYSISMDRKIQDRIVLGSELTVYFSADGSITGLTNGIASAVADVRESLNFRGAEKRIQKTINRVQFEALKKNAQKVLVPEENGGETFLREALLLTWQEQPKKSATVNHAMLLGVSGNMKSSFTSVSPVEFEPARHAASPHYHTDERTGLPDEISYHAVGGVSIAALPLDRNPAEIAYRFLEEHPSLFRTGAARCQYRVGAIHDSPLLPNVHFVRMEQQYLGLPVFGAELVIEIHDRNKVMSVAGHALPSINVNPEPRLKAGQAVAAANQFLATSLQTQPAPVSSGFLQEVTMRPATTELVIFPGPIVPRRKLQTRLAYRVTIGSFVYFIDAENGEELYAYSTRSYQTVTINDALMGSETARLGYRTVQINAIPTGVLPLNGDVTPIFGSMSGTAAFYATLGWSGLDGGGSGLTANTNVAMVTGCPNAFYDPYITKEAFFCIGVGSQPDSVAHEFTHGVIWNSSRLIPLDESGAMNEAYADLFGNLISPDVISPGATSGWLIGESPTAGGPAIGTGTVRDMAVPATFGHPGTMGGYINRSFAAGCNPFIMSCDSGFIHSNCGIINRAHVLIAGTPGGTAPAPPTSLPGIGRPKLSLLAFLVMTTRLTPWSQMMDASIATQDMINTLVMRGAVTAGLPPAGGVPFVQTDADQIPIAFSFVDLNPNFSTGWAEPAMGFDGIDTYFGSGETTENGCAVTNVVATLDTPSGQFRADLSPATTDPTAVSWGGLFGISFFPPPPAIITPAPLGTTSKRHFVKWSNVFGEKPSYNTRVVAPPPTTPPGTLNCVSATGSIPVERINSWTTHFSFLIGGKGMEIAGNAASTMSPLCTVRDMDLELVDAAGHLIAGPSKNVFDSVTIGRIFNQPIIASRGASIAGPIPTAPPNLSVAVNWWFESGVAVRYRLRYYIDQPAGISCTSPTEF